MLPRKSGLDIAILRLPPLPPPLRQPCEHADRRIMHGIRERLGLYCLDSDMAYYAAETRQHALPDCVRGIIRHQIGCDGPPPLSVEEIERNGADGVHAIKAGCILMTKLRRHPGSPVRACGREALKA